MIVRAEPILIIDDDDQIRHLARRILESKGWTCREAAARLEALKAIDDTRPCLIVLDWQLGDRSEGPFLGELERLHAAVPVVVVSGHPPDPRATSARNFAGWRMKPFGCRELVQAVHTALAA